MKIKSFSGEIYNASGERVKKIKNSDINDASAVSGGTLYADSRQKILHFSCNNYPYTIVYEYERSLDGILNYPSWSFQSGFKTSVISSKIDFIIPKKYLNDNDISGGIEGYCRLKSGFSDLAVIHYVNNKIDKFTLTIFIKYGYINLSDSDRALIPYISEKYRDICFEISQIEYFIVKLRRMF